MIHLSASVDTSIWTGIPHTGRQCRLSLDIVVWLNTISLASHMRRGLTSARLSLWSRKIVACISDSFPSNRDSRESKGQRQHLIATDLSSFTHLSDLLAMALSPIVLDRLPKKKWRQAPPNDESDSHELL